MPARANNRVAQSSCLPEEVENSMMDRLFQATCDINVVGDFHPLQSSTMKFVGAPCSGSSLSSIIHPAPIPFMVLVNRLPAIVPNDRHGGGQPTNTYRT